MYRILFLLLTFLLALGQFAFADEKYAVEGEKHEIKGAKFRVVINHEEQYSIWVADEKLPPDWKATGFVGSKESSLRYIEEVWTDMRPLSERRETALKIYKELKQRE